MCTYMRVRARSRRVAGYTRVCVPAGPRVLPLSHGGVRGFPWCTGQPVCTHTCAFLLHTRTCVWHHVPTGHGSVCAHTCVYPCPRCTHPPAHVCVCACHPRGAESTRSPLPTHTGPHGRGHPKARGSPGTAQGAGGAHACACSDTGGKMRALHGPTQRAASVRERLCVCTRVGTAASRTQPCTRTRGSTHTQLHTHTAARTRVQPRVPCSVHTHRHTRTCTAECAHAPDAEGTLPHPAHAPTRTRRPPPPQ